MNNHVEDNKFVKLVQTWLIDFVDAVLIRLCQFLLMIGFILGTIAVLSSRFNIASMPDFNLWWSVIQAIAIDGLFFAVWSIWSRTKGSGWIRTWYFIIGCLLGGVASLVNNVVSFSEINKVPSIQLAMQQLHIGVSTFTLGRSLLVVLVSILIVTLPRNVSPPALEVETPTDPMLAVLQKSLTVMEELSKSQHLQVNESPVKPLLDQPVEPTHLSVAPVEAKNYGDQICEIIQANPSLTASEVAAIVKCSEKTVYSWKKRLQKERDTDPLPLVNL